DLQGNHFFIVSANGYPFGKAIIADVLSDVHAHGHVDWLFVCIDAEEETVDVRRQEVEEAVQQSLSTASLSYSIIVQNRTIETWFLGNRRIPAKAD
ncbi:MAG: hypothetical protein NTW69_01070, partial [Chloroflexi bacterium]|nr:hypothetical protein [Chloroflexota bacterium]